MKSQKVLRHAMTEGNPLRPPHLHFIIVIVVVIVIVNLSSHCLALSISVSSLLHVLPSPFCCLRLHLRLRCN